MLGWITMGAILFGLVELAAAQQPWRLWPVGEPACKVSRPSPQFFDTQHPGFASPDNGAAEAILNVLSARRRTGIRRSRRLERVASQLKRASRMHGSPQLVSCNLTLLAVAFLMAGCRARCLF